MNQLTKYWHDFLKVFSRYMLVGLTNTLICCGLMFIGAHMGLGYLTYTAIAYLVTIFLSFFMNMLFTFRVRGQVIRRLLGFLLLCMINLVFVECFEYLLIEFASFKPWVAIICSMTWYSTTSFFISRRWIYK